MCVCARVRVHIMRRPACVHGRSKKESELGMVSMSWRVSKETQKSVKRDLVECEKRPSRVSKETL
jgi:hypothetical protein